MNKSKSKGVNFTTNHIIIVNHKLIREIHSMHNKARVTLVVKKLPSLRNKFNPSSIGTNLLPNL